MVCFAAWGLIAAFAPRFRETFHLTPSQTALLVAIPVLLGSLARIPMGILTDRFGGRAIFSILMVAPGWHASRTDPQVALRGGRGSVGPNRGVGRDLLVAGEVALAVLLTVARA